MKQRLYMVQIDYNGLRTSCQHMTVEEAVAWTARWLHAAILGGTPATLFRIYSIHSQVYDLDTMEPVD